MSLLKKTVLIIGLTFASLCLVLYSASEHVLLGGYDAIEQDDAVGRVTAVRAAFDNILDGLDAMTRDWARWDDSYQFMADRNETYIRATLINESLVNAGLTLIAYVRPDGSIHYAKAVSVDDGRSLAVPDGILRFLTADSPLLNMVDPLDGRKGLVVLPEAVYLVACRPILRSDQSGDSRGFLVMGTNLTASHVNTLCRLSREEVTINRLDLPDTVVASTERILADSEGQLISLNMINDQWMEGTTTLADINGVPALSLRVTMGREIHRQRQTTERFLVWTLLISGLCCGIVVVLLLRSEFLSRLSSLSQTMARVEDSDSLSDRVAVTGNDELAELAASFNRMLDSLQSSRARMRDSETRYRGLFEFAPIGILVTTFEGRILECNSTFAETVGFPKAQLLNMPVTDLYLNPEDRGAIVLMLKSGDDLRHTDILFRHKDGTPKCASCKLSRVRINGEDCLLSATLDITQRKQMEESLHKNLAAMDAANEGMAIIDEIGKLSYVNRAYAGVHGYENRQEVVGQTWWQLYTPEDVRRLQDEVLPYLWAHGVWRGEVTGRQRNGCTFPQELSLTVIGNREIIAVIRDISMRKRYELQLQTAFDNRRELENIINNSPVILFLWRNEKGWPVEFVSENIRLLGYTTDDFTSGRIAFDTIIHPEDLPRVQAEIVRFSAEKRLSFAQDYRVFTRDGHVRWLSDRSCVRMDESGKITHFHGVCIDVTQQREAEHALRESEKRYRAIFDSFVDVYFEATSEGVLKTVSPSCPQILGYLADDLVGTNAADLFVHENGWRRLQRLLRARGSVEDLTTMFSHSDGRSLHVSINARVLPEMVHGEALITGTLRDVSERVRASEELRIYTEHLREAKEFEEQNARQLKALVKELERARKTAEAATNAKSQFLANMSHELRTPLNSIIGFADLMHDGTVGAVDDKQREYLELISNSGGHLLGLINDVLDIAKIEAGKMTIDPEPCQVEHLLENCLTMVKSLAIKGKITLEASIGDIGEVELDAQKIRQVVYNLLSNAIKFTPEGGTVQVAANRSDDELIVSVSDTGIGIRECDLEMVFSEFEQVDDTATRKFQGTGLGLPLSRKFVELHGGRLWVESVHGEGSCFSFAVPVSSPRLSGRQYEDLGTDTPTGPTGRTILVVDDEEANLLLARNTLERAGHTVVTARGAAEALRLVGGVCPEVILCDIHMPDMDGITFLRSLADDAATSGIPVIAVTAHAMKGDRDFFLETGFAGYVSKPINVRTLVQDIETILTRDGIPDPRPTVS